jgi:hypothetical protein
MIKQVNLEKIIINFTYGNDLFYKMGLGGMDNGKVAKLAGHNVKNSDIAGHYIGKFRSGRYTAHELKNICAGAGLDAKELLTNPHSFEYKDSRFDNVDEETRKEVYNAICDES